MNDPKISGIAALNLKDPSLFRQQCYIDGKWADAYDLLMRQFPEDLAAQCLLRVMDQAKKRLPANWDGSFVPPTAGE